MKSSDADIAEVARNGVYSPNRETRERNYRSCIVLPRYPTSNEIYSKDAVAFLDGYKADRFDGYIGICGGGTQNLFILSRLLRGNHLKSIVLLDIDINQLHNFAYLVRKHNTKNERRYQRILSERGIEALTPRETLDFLSVNITKPVITNDVSIGLECMDILEYLKRINENGRYFIYLSNAVSTNHIGERDTKAIFRKILESEKFESGTARFASIHLDKVIVIEKRGEDLTQAFADGKNRLFEYTIGCVRKEFSSDAGV